MAAHIRPSSASSMSDLSLRTIPTIPHIDSIGPAQRASDEVLGKLHSNQPFTGWPMSGWLPLSRKCAGQLYPNLSHQRNALNSFPQARGRIRVGGEIDPQLAQVIRRGPILQELFSVTIFLKLTNYFFIQAAEFINHRLVSGTGPHHLRNPKTFVRVVTLDFLKQDFGLQRRSERATA